MRPAFIGLLLLALPAPAAACVPCAAGDPTLTVMGAEQPVEGRVRFSLELLGRWDQRAADDVLLVEGRASFAASYAPTRWLTLSAALPLVLRDLQQGPLTRYTTFGLGDAELRARFVWLQDHAFAPEHLFGPTLGVRLPTALDQVADGRRLPIDAQTGAGTIDPLLGLFYAHFADPWSLFTTATVALPTAPRYADAPGPSLLTTAAVQYRFDDALTLRLAVDARLDAPALVAGQRDPRSDHFALFLSPELLWSPVTGWIVQLGVRAPVLQVSEQGREEGWTIRAALTVDVS